MRPGKRRSRNPDTVSGATSTRGLDRIIDQPDPRKKVLGAVASVKMAHSRQGLSLHRMTKPIGSQIKQTDNQTNLKIKEEQNCVRPAQSLKWKPKQLDNFIRTALLFLDAQELGFHFLRVVNVGIGHC